MVKIFHTARHKVDKKKLQTQAEALLEKYNVPYEYTTNIIFVGVHKMKEIALKYKQENVALPVLTFSYVNDVNTEERLLGEVFICYPQAVLLAAEKNKTIDTMLYDLIEHAVGNLLKG